MIATLSVLLLQASSPVVAPRQPPLSDTITVTGVRIADLRAAVEACAAAPCPPRQDIVAAVRYAEALFRTGDVQGARKVLQGSARRTKGAAAAEPIAVSQLYLAQANVAAHYGDEAEVRDRTLASARVVRDNLPPDSADVLLAELRVADVMMRQSDAMGAERKYERIAATARPALPALAAVADLRRAWLLHQGGSKAQSRALLAALIATPGDAARSIRLAARVTEARIARVDGDKNATAALAAALAAEPQGAAPVLIYAPPFPELADAVDRNKFETPIDASTKPTDYNALGWVDIGFWIRPNGTVEGAETVDGSPRNSWAAPVVAMIAARRYSAFVGDGGGQGQYRLERYTLTSDFSTPLGSLIRRRAGLQHFEQLDLTRPPPAATASGS